MSKALEIVSLGRLLETGVIRLAARNELLIRRFETARWVEPTGRKGEWRIRDGIKTVLEERLNDISPSWVGDFQYLRSIDRDPYDPHSIEALPALMKQKPVAGMVNRRNWNAAAGLGPKHEAQLPSTAILTKDWVLRFRPNKGLRGVFDGKEISFEELAIVLTECLIPERLWLGFEGFSGDMPKLIVTCENLGAYIDLALPNDVIAVYAPGADIEAAAALMRHCPDAKWIHFGDIDPDGLQIAENVAKETNREPNFYVPSFAEEYLPGRPVETRWKKTPDLPLFHELLRTQKRIFQEVFMLDPRLGEEIAAMVRVTKPQGVQRRVIPTIISSD